MESRQSQSQYGPHLRHSSWATSYAGANIDSIFHIIIPVRGSVRIHRVQPTRPHIYTFWQRRRPQQRKIYLKDVKIFKPFQWRQPSALIPRPESSTLGELWRAEFDAEMAQARHAEEHLPGLFVTLLHALSAPMRHHVVEAHGADGFEALGEDGREK